MYVAKDSRSRRLIRYSTGVLFTWLALSLCQFVSAQSSPPPTITSIQPVTGVTNGGTLVTIIGSNFQAGATVSFGATPALTTSVVSSTTLTAITPGGTFGAVDVTVSNPDSQIATLHGAFTYAIQGVYVWTTIAGLAAQGSLNGTNSGARFSYPEAVAQDAAGNIYLANNGDHTIRKLTLQGTNWVSSTIAGKPGQIGYTDGTNDSILFRDPRGIVVDAQTNVFVADAFAGTIRELSPQGSNWVSRTIAGIGGHNFGFTDGTNQGISLDFPVSIVMDVHGNLFVGGTETVREIMPQGTNWVSQTIASPSPQALAVDAQDNIYVADSQKRIDLLQMIGTNWVMSTIAGQTFKSGTTDGTNQNATFGSPAGIAVDSYTNVYVADGAANTIRLLTPVGTNWVSSTIAGTANVAGSADGTNNAALFYHPQMISVGINGDILIADLYNSTIRDLTLSGTNWITTTLAGQAGSAGTADGTNGDIRFRTPAGLSLDHSGNLLVADSGNNSIRILSPVGTNWLSTTILDQNCIDGRSGTNRTLAAPFLLPTDVVADKAGDLFVVDSLNTCIRVITNYQGTNYSSVIAGVSGSFGMYPPGGFENPTSIALDASGSYYVADPGSEQIAEYSWAGSANLGTGIRFAGTLTIGSGDGSGTQITFKSPTGIAIDAATNVYITDSGNDTIRKLAPSNGVYYSTTIAGMVGLTGSVDGTNRGTLFSNPYSIAVDAQTNLYVAELANSTIRKLTPVGTNWVSSTIGGYAGVYGATDGTNNFSSFSAPQGIAVDTNGNVYVSDSLNNTIRRGTFVAGVKVSANISWANPLPMIYGTPLSAAQLDATVDTPGALSYYPPLGTILNPGTNNLSVIFTPNDTINYATLTNIVNLVVVPFPPAVTLAGTNAAIYGSNFVLSASVSGPGPLFLQWTLNGTNLNNTLIKTFAGNGSTIFTNGNLATNTGMGQPAGLIQDKFGNFFVADSYNRNVYKIAPNGIATAIAGKGFTGSSSGDGGAATNASFTGLAGITVDSSENLFMADSTGARIRKIDANGIITTFAGKGSTSTSFSGDGGPAVNAGLSNPSDVAVDTNGNLYIADTGHGCVRKVDLNGVITTVAGIGTNQAFSGDGGAATNAGMSSPKGVTLDTLGNLYIADSAHGTVRKVDANGIITSVAGKGTSGSTAGDGGQATNATFGSPAGIKLDSVGNLFITDSSAYRVRKVDTNGIVTTIAGGGSSGVVLDGILATNATFNGPVGLILDAGGDVFVADVGNWRVREIYISPVLNVTNVSLTNAGNYQLTVTSPYGVATVSQTVAVGLAPLQFTLPVSNQVTFQFTGKPVTKYVLQSATNLAPPTVWTPVTTNFSNPSGAWSATATNKSPNLYYRVRTP